MFTVGLDHRIIFHGSHPGNDQGRYIPLATFILQLILLHWFRAYNLKCTNLHDILGDTASLFWMSWSMNRLR